MSVQKLAGRYAKSLIDLSIEQNKLDRVLEDVKVLHEVSDNRDFKLMLRSPVLKADKKRQVVNHLFKDQFDPLTIAFLDIMFRKGREAHLVEIAGEFIDQYKKIKRISSVRLVSAAPLSKDTFDQILKILQESPIVEDTVDLQATVNEELIGGFTIELDDKLYDDSVAFKLAELRKEFKGNLYISLINDSRNL
jgi:F-type H+-transporting ATPase subunit delta